MKHSYTCRGEYKGQNFKVISTKVCQEEECEFGAVLEVNGVKRHARIGTKKNKSENINDAIEAAIRYIDSITQIPVSHYSLQILRI